MYSSESLTRASKKHYTMDCDKLISLIHQRRPLWDQTSKNYHNRKISRKLWEEIAVRLNTSIEAVKHKWRNLRDTFRQELSKSKYYVNGKNSRTSWTYYESMMFIRHQFALKKSFELNDSNSLLNADQNINAQKDDADTFAYQDFISIKMESPDETENFPTIEEYPTETLINDVTIYREEKKHNKSKRIKLSENNSEQDSGNISFDDSDYHFLMSLLPYLQGVSMKRKLTVRTKILQILADEDLSNETNEHVNQSSIEMSQASPLRSENLSESQNVQSSTHHEMLYVQDGLVE